MLSNMEKFINFKQLNVVTQATATADGSATLKLIASGGTFFENTLVNAIVWDRTTAAADGGQKYIVTAVDSTTQLSLVALGQRDQLLGQAFQIQLCALSTCQSILLYTGRRLTGFKLQGLIS